MDSRVSKLTCMALTLACVSTHADSHGSPGCCEAGPAPMHLGNAPSKWDIFAGYSYLAPKE